MLYTTMNPPDSLFPAPSQSEGLPWRRLMDAGWLILQMNHYRANGRNYLFCCMAKGTTNISDEDDDEIRLFKKLEVKAKLEKRSALPKKEAPAADPRHREFMSQWSSRYQRFFQNPYIVSGPKDGTHLKRFLCASPDLKVATMMDYAELAWERQERDAFCKSCKMSTSITGFLCAWNGIVAELNRGKCQMVEGGGF